MKKICKLLIFVILTQVVIVCLSGCSLKTKKDNGDVVYKKDFGSYKIKAAYLNEGKLPVNDSQLIITRDVIERLENNNNILVLLG